MPTKKKGYLTKDLISELSYEGIEEMRNKYLK